MQTSCNEVDNKQQQCNIKIESFGILKRIAAMMKNAARNRRDREDNGKIF
jgi:hypothetical protein